MTLALFLKCKNGVVVASDTQSTIGDMMKRSGASKINKINDKIIWAGSGDEAFLSDIDDEIKNLREFNFIRDGMNMESIKEIISEKVLGIFMKYKKRFDKLSMEPPTGTIIIATFEKENCFCNGLLMNFTGTAYKINEGYEAIGSSKAYAEVLLKSYYDINMDFEKGIRLSHWIINQCSKTDLFVNENVTIYIIKTDNKNNVNIEKISDEKITELNNVSEQTTDVFRSIYHQMDIASLMNLLSENSNKEPNINMSENMKDNNI